MALSKWSWHLTLRTFITAWPYLPVCIQSSHRHTFPHNVCHKEASSTPITFSSVPVFQGTFKFFLPLDQPKCAGMNAREQSLGLKLQKQPNILPKYALTVIQFQSFSKILQPLPLQVKQTRVYIKTNNPRRKKVALHRTQKLVTWRQPAAGNRITRFIHNLTLPGFIK